jgi:hypothetical protein
MARKVGQSSEVLGPRDPLSLEAPHLTQGSRALRRFAADNPAHIANSTTHSSREIGTSSGGRSPAEQHPILIGEQALARRFPTRATRPRYIPTIAPRMMF